jgi:uncharacterized protein YggE
MTISYWMNSGQTQPRLYMKRAQINEDANIDNALSEPVISIGKNTYRFTVNVRFELK